MILGVSTGGYINRSAPEAVARIAEAGVRVIEVSTWRAHFDLTDPGQVDSLQRALARHQVKAHSLHSPFAWGRELGAVAGGERREAVQMACQAARVLATLGGQVLVVHPLEAHLEPDSPELAARLAAARRSLEEVLACCRSFGVEMAVEEMLPHLAGGTPAQLQAVTEGLGEGWGYCLDTSHAALNPVGIPGWVQAMAGRLALVHASDNRGRDDDHLPPGQGTIAWDGVCRELARAGFAGGVILELNPAHTGHLAAAVAATRRLLAM